MRLYLNNARREATIQPDQSPASNEDQKLVFGLLGNTKEVADFFGNNDLTIQRFAALLRAERLEHGSQSAAQYLFAAFRSCFQSGQAKDGPLAESKALVALFEKAMDAVLASKDEASVKALCASGFDINGKDQDGMTYLTHALEEAYPDLELLRLLCRNGAKLNNLNRFLDQNIREGQVATLAVLVENGAISQGSLDSLLHLVMAAPRGARKEMLRLLLDNGASLNCSSGDPISVVCHAARHRDADCVKFLIGRGGMPKGKKEVNQLLCIAIVLNDFEMTRLFMALGGSIEGLSATGQDFARRAQMTSLAGSDRSERE